MAVQISTTTASRRALLTAGAAAIIGGSLAGIVKAFASAPLDGATFLREFRELGGDFWIARHPNGREEMGGYHSVYLPNGMTPEEWDRRFKRLNEARERPGFIAQVRDAIISEGSVYEIPAA